MILTKRTAGKRLPGDSDLRYAIKELKAAGLSYTGFAVNPDNKQVELEKVKNGADVKIQVLQKGKPVFEMQFISDETLQSFQTTGKKAGCFKDDYVAAYGTLVKRGGLRWSIGRIMNMILSFFEAARLEAEAAKLLRKEARQQKQRQLQTAGMAVTDGSEKRKQ